MDWFFDHGPELLLESVADDAEGGNRGLVVRDVSRLEEVATSELIKVVARVDRRVHVLEHRRCGVNTSRGQTYLLLGVNRVGVDEHGVVGAMEGLRCEGGA